MSKKDMRVSTKEMTVLKKDISVSKQEIGVSKTNLMVSKEDISVSKKDINELKKETSVLKQRTNHLLKLITDHNCRISKSVADGFIVKVKMVINFVHSIISLYGQTPPSEKYAGRRS